MAVCSAKRTLRLLSACLLLPAGHALALEPGLSAQEEKLRAAVALWEAGDTRAALSGIDALLQLQPDFQAAHLLRSKWLLARAGRGLPVNGNGEAEAVAQLLDEVRLRVTPPEVPQDALPAGVLRLPEHVDHLIAVDMRASRLYVLRNNGTGLHVVRDFYASIGSAGYGKQVEGDLRTPVGIYRVTRWLDGARLPDLYGHGAYPVNYPNDWDRALGRTGHGIWIHGVPRAAYSRLPRSSEGCVTLSNDDFDRLGSIVDVGRTPVLLAESLHWLPEQLLLAERDAFERELEAWRAAWSALDTDRYLDYYAENFSDGRSGLAAWRAHKQQVNAAKQWADVALHDLTVMDYPGERGLRMVEFRQDYRSSNFESVSRKRQYWRLQDDGRWLIEREVTL